jgi:glycosyltransferase involved in cell wall biosynthesis
MRMSSEGYNNTAYGHPLVSVVITTYNHAAFLPDAIGSVLGQTYKNIELIVIDDGSTDNTKGLMCLYPQVKYHFQENRGLPAARNTGAILSSGVYIVFLDADDMFYPDAIAVNVKYFSEHPEYGFISGGHDLMTEDKQIMDSPEWQQFPSKDHYLSLLRNDYISMHAAVMYRKEVFTDHHYDETLISCEDYDFYLQIAKNYPVLSHNIKLAAYRKHANSMSMNILQMYHSAIKVIHKHYHTNAGDDVVNSCKKGIRDVRSHYAELLFGSMITGNIYKEVDFREIISVISLLSRGYFFLLIRYYLEKILRWVSRKSFSFARRIARIISGGSEYIVPRVGKVWIQDLNRSTPFNISSGIDQSGHIDNYYIEQFLRDNACYVKGNVLVMGNGDDTLTYGGEGVIKYDLLHIYALHSQSPVPDKFHYIPADFYDCIIIRQSLHLVYDFNSIIRNCFRSLKKEGVLLLTVPGITPVDPDEDQYHWYWSFTGNAIDKLLMQYFDPVNIQVHTFGNVLVAASFLYGIEVSKLNKIELEQHDPAYQVVIAAKAVKS